jgi:hypothetical protein
MSDETESFDVIKVVKETDKALLVRLDDGEEKWVPKSVIHDDSEIFSDATQEGKLILQAWFVERWI